MAHVSPVESDTPHECRQQLTYSNVCSLLIVALLAQIPGRRFEGIIAFAIVVLGLFVGASWGDYSFGDSFGSRQSIELLPLC